MSTYTDHGLVCLDDEDYAAIALAMQTDALATDASLTSINNSFNTINSYPYAFFTTTAGSTVSSGGEQQFAQGAWSVTASRGFPIVSILTPLIGSVATVQATTTGWYEYGNYLNLTLAGAATAFSRREIFASVYSLSGATAVRLDEIRWRTVENSVAGGEFLIASGGSFYATAGTTILPVARWSHANLASQVTSQPGALFWITYVGTGIEIGSA